jgi:hypothetical protein
LSFYFLDATNPSNGDIWHRLLFDHEPKTYQSALSNTGMQATLRVQHPGARWPHMLFHDIYHGPPYPHEGYGGLTGQLDMLLALIAFSMPPHRLEDGIVHMVEHSQWTVHNRSHGSKLAPKSTCS